MCMDKDMDVLLLIGVVVVNLRTLVDSQKSFILGFQETYTYSVTTEGRIYLVNPNTEPAQVAIDTPLITSGPSSLAVTLDVAADSFSYVTVPDDVHCTGGSLIGNKGIRITSDRDIVVQANARGFLSSAAFEVPPISELGYVHVAVTYKYPGSSSYQGPYEFLVVATEAATEVQITLYGDPSLRVVLGGTSYYHGDVITATIGAHQTILIQCPYGDGGDISGSLVVASRPVFVTSGAVASSVLALQWPDNLMVTVPPAERLGKDYVTSAVVTRTTGDVLLIVNLVEGNNVIIYNDGGTVIANDNFVDFETKTYVIPASRGYHVTSNYPIMVAQLTASHQYETNSNTDPFLLIHEAVTDFRSSDVTFSTMSHYGATTAYDHHLQVVIETGFTSGLILDGASLVATWVDMTTIQMSVATVTLSAGKHRLYHTSNQKFSAFAYGERSLEAYAVLAQPTPGSFSFTSYARTLEEALYGLPTTTVQQSTDLTTIVTTQLETTPPTTESDTTSLPDSTQVTYPVTTTIGPDTTTTYNLDTTNSNSGSIATTAASETTTSQEPSTTSLTATELTTSTSIVEGTQQTTHPTPTAGTSTDSSLTVTISTDLSTSHTTTSTRIPESTNSTSGNIITSNSSDVLSTPSANPGEWLFADGKVLLDAWSEWTMCSSPCGEDGTRFRLRICANKTDNVCTQELVTSRGQAIAYKINSEACNHHRCPIAGSWLPWLPWSECTATCGMGVRRRKRTCDGPHYGGDACRGSSQESVECHTNIPCKGVRRAVDAIEPMVDERPSTLALGSVGLVIPLLVLVGILVLDVPTFWEHTRWIRRKAR